MQREAIRIVTGTPAVKTDVPLGVFASGDVAIYDGTQVKGASLASMGIPAVERAGNVWSSDLAPIAGALMGAAAGYFVYMGLTTRQIQANFVEFAVSVIGAGAQTCEVGFFSTPVGPNRAAQSLTKLGASGAVDALTSLGVKRNTADLATAIASGVHLWCGIRQDMITTEATIVGLTNDFAEGRILSVAAPGALTGAGPFAGAIVAHSIAWQAPDLRLVFT